ncbi:hypothetical protein GOBAR_DD28943 [Gossypium barbadense]|nr:hypothetical protein GOBAR_DD28943 [Gossypium barbadense]
MDTTKLTSNAIKGDEETLALQAIEFWSCVCGEEIELRELESPESGDSGPSHSGIPKKALLSAIPLLLETLLKQKEDQDQDDTITNIYMACGTCLVLFARTVGEIVQLTLLQSKPGMGNIFSVSLSLDPIITRCSDCATGQASYICNLEDNLHALQAEVAGLKAIRRDLMSRVRVAEDEKQLKRLPQVDLWLSRAETLINDADQLIVQGPQHVENLCMGGCCTTHPRSSIKFGKQIAKKLLEVKDQKENGDFSGVASKPPLPSATERPSEPTVGLESNFNKVWSCLQKEQVGIIGIYGLGGVGKTSLLSQINNKFHDTTHDYHVIWAVASQDRPIERVQDQITERIGLSNEGWKSKSLDEKAEGIFQVSNWWRVSRLSDVPPEVELVGIHSSEKREGSGLISKYYFGRIASRNCKVGFTRTSQFVRDRNKKLPVELKALAKLKYLNLEWTADLKMIPQQLISSFSKLQVLKMEGCGYGCLFVLEEMEHLRYLNVLTLTFRWVSELEKASRFNKFFSCAIEAVKLEDFRDSRSLNIMALAKLQHLCTLCIWSCMDLEEVKIERNIIEGAGCFHSLRSVTVDVCNHLRDVSWVTFAPHLEKLRIYECNGLEEIISEEKLGEIAELKGNLNLFSKLKGLFLDRLPKLKTIYHHALPFAQLKEIRIVKCPMLKKLPLNSNSAKGQRLVIKGEEGWWKDVEWEDESTQIAFLPTFKPWIF